MQNTQKKGFASVTSNTSTYLIIFFFAIGLRAVPELLSGVYPVGFDTMQGYVPSILALPDNTPMKLFGWAYSPLAIYILWSVYTLSKINPYLLLKIMGPVFYGLFNVSFYYALSKGLGWKSKMSFFVSVLFLLQPAVLRTGWDQLREELALMFLFILLAQTKCNVVNNAKTKPFLISVLSILIVFSHQLIAVLLFILVIWQLFGIWTKKEASVLKLAAAFVPAALIFGWQLYSQFLSPSWSQHFMPIELQNGTGTFIFTNYFLNDPRFLNGNYLTVLTYVGSLALYTIVPLLPFAIKGFSKDKVFTPLLGWLLVASFSIVIYPKYALAQYWWWILLLPIPLTIYFVSYLNKIKVFDNQRRLRTATAALAILAIISVGYATSTIRIGSPYVYTYLPSGLVESSIPLSDIPDAEKALKWVNENTPANSTLIVPEKLQGTAYIHIRSDIQIRIAQAMLTLDSALQNAKLNATNIYTIYYSDEIGNYNHLRNLAQFGSIEVYQVFK